jgi:riboflavin synthase
VAENSAGIRLSVVANCISAVTFAAMFTGIVECSGTVTELQWQHGVLQIWVASPLSGEFKIDQSICHDGVCLTVVNVKPGQHQVQVIKETLDNTNICIWDVGTVVNMERSMPANGRFDGHIVQGHVDGIAAVSDIKKSEGQVEIFFKHKADLGITVAKGSICVNGVSLTVVHSSPDSFSVALIPYTLEHTNLGALSLGSPVNIEFDIVGKYMQKMLRT